MIKRLFKWTFLLGVGLVLIGGGLVLLRNVLGRSALEHWLQNTLGYEAVVGTLRISLGEPVVTVRNVRLLNPRDLIGGRPFLDIPEIRVVYDRDALAYGELRVRELRLRVTAVSMARSPQGHSTQQILVERLRELQNTNPDGFGSFQFLGMNVMRFSRVDLLRLSVEGNYEYLDYAQMALSQELRLSVQDYRVANLLTVQDLADRYVAFARHTGVRLVPVPQSRPPATAPGQRPASDGPPR